MHFSQRSSLLSTCHSYVCCGKVRKQSNKNQRTGKQTDRQTNKHTNMLIDTTNKKTNVRITRQTDIIKVEGKEVGHKHRKRDSQINRNASRQIDRQSEPIYVLENTQNHWSSYRKIITVSLCQDFLSVLWGIFFQGKVTKMFKQVMWIYTVFQKNYDNKTLHFLIRN